MVAKESKDRASLERTKVVVRHLPAGLTQDGFVKTISKFVDPDRYNWLAYYPGKVSIKSTVLSRAYLNFVDPHSVYEFKAKFDGHLFVSNKGNQYRCSVEYAPFQKVPLPSKKNPLENTIHQDPDYQQFAQQLQDGPALLPSAAAQRESQERAAAMAGTPPDGPPTNALLEYLKAKYQSNPAMKLGGVRRRARPEQDDQVGKPGTVIAGPNSRPTSKGASSKAQTAATTAATAATAAVKGSSRGGRDPAGDSKAGPPASSSSSKEPAGPASTTSTVQARTPATHAPKVIMSRAGHLSSASTGPTATATAIAAAAATAAATGRPSSAAPSVLARGAAPSQAAPATAPAPARPPPSSGPAGGSQRGPSAARAPTSGLSAARDSSKGPATAAAATTVTTASGSASTAAPASLQRSLASARAPVTLAARSTGNGVNAASSALVRAGSGSDATQPATANGAGAAAAAASAALVGGSAEGEGAPGPKRKVRMGFQAYKPPIRSHDPEGG